MAAVHRRKRTDCSSVDGLSSWDHYKVKKKKVNSIKSRFNSKSHISLEWDDRLNKVVARKDQISISKRDMLSLSTFIPQPLNNLADVISVPCEIFGLENLKGVLSKEVWCNILSENERKSLFQFLPCERNQEKIVDALLSGDNLHFGNSFLQWGSKLCSGNLHPDSVYSEEECLMEQRKRYYSEIQKYHTDMIDYLQKLKDALEDSNVTKMNDLQEIWRPRKGQDDSTLRSKKKYVFDDCEDEIAASSNSSSWNEEDKACSSNTQVSSILKSGALQQRISNVISRDHRRYPVLSDDLGKGEKVQKYITFPSDGASYMSYVKVSKRQYDLVKSLKQSGQIIHSKSLYRLLGASDTLHVHPFEEFEKEEMKKLQDHWLQLVNLELPTAYANWRERKEHRGKIITLLSQELEDSAEPCEETKNGNHELDFQDKIVKGVSPTCINNEENECDEESLEHQLPEQNDESLRYQETCFESDIDDSSSPFRLHVDDTAANQEIGGEAFGEAACDSNHSKREGFESASDSDHSMPQAFQAVSTSNHSTPQTFEEDDVPSHNNAHGLNAIEGEPANILLVSNSKDELPETSNFSVKGKTLQTSMEPLIQFSSDGSLYMSDTINTNTSTGCGVSITSGNGYSHVADNRDASSMYQGVGFSSGRDIYSLNARSVVPSITQRTALSSNGGMYGVDANSADSSVNHGVTLPSVAGFYTVDGNDADISVPQRGPISSGAGMLLVDANNVGSPIVQEPISCGKDGWPMVNIGQCYYDSGRKEYSSTHDVPLSPIDAHHSTMIEMDDSTQKRLLQRHCDDSSFNSYSIPDRSGLLQSLFHRQDMAYPTEQKHNGLDFRTQSGVLLQDGSFTGNVHANLHPLMAIEQGKKIGVENYMPQSSELYPESNGYLMPREGGHINMPDWTSDSVRMQSQVQSHIPHEGMLTHKWYSSELRGHWSHSNCVSSSVSSQNIGNSADQGLYSVLSQCNQLRTDRPFDTIPANEQLMIPRSYPVIGGGSRVSNVLPQLPHALEFFGGRDSAATSIMPDSSAWVNLSQNPSHDSMGKPFLRSWNQ